MPVSEAYSTRKQGRWHLRRAITRATLLDTSSHPVMHVCGHNAHVACVLGGAKLLVAQEGILRGHLKFLLQPADMRDVGRRSAQSILP
jgi:metal-dependent amidase/aminoacylase/carboxypeptidase family protein